LTWRTAIFHPNILSGNRNGGVCLGGWSPAETLADLCIRLAEMIQYKNYNTDDPLDLQAAAWAAQNRAHFPIDGRPIISRSLIQS
jgi:ubiquitin-protein ligase